MPPLAALNTLLARIPEAPVALLLRVFPALVFWQSGQTKVEGFLRAIGVPNAHFRAIRAILREPAA